MSDGSRTVAAIPVEAEQTPAGKRRRFAPADASVSYAIARGLLPASPWRLTAAVAMGLAAVALVVLADVYLAQLPAAAAPLADVQSPTSVVRWLTSLLMTSAACLCLVVYGLRSSRTDDVRGQYRWWLTAGVVGLLASGCYATGAHRIAATELSLATGVNALGGNVWWLVPTAIGMAALAIRPVADLKESRVSLTLLVATVVSLVASVLAHLGVGPAVALEQLPVVSAGSLLAAFIFGMAAQLRYIRRVLLETDGRLEAPAAKVKTEKTQEETADQQPQSSKAPAQQPAAKATRAATPTPAKQPTSATTEPKPQRSAQKASRQPQPAVKVAQESRWTDGSDGDDAGYDDDQPRRKLTKAERKRLRKQKAGRYAA